MHLRFVSERKPLCSRLHQPGCGHRHHQGPVLDPVQEVLQDLPVVLSRQELLPCVLLQFQSFQHVVANKVQPGVHRRRLLRFFHGRGALRYPGASVCSDCVPTVMEMRCLRFFFGRPGTQRRLIPLSVLLLRRTYCSFLASLGSLRVVDKRNNDNVFIHVKL